MICAVSDAWQLTQWINCSFYHLFTNKRVFHWNEIICLYTLGISCCRLMMYSQRQSLAARRKLHFSDKHMSEPYFISSPHKIIVAHAVSRHVDSEPQYNTVRESSLSPWLSKCRDENSGLDGNTGTLLFDSEDIRDNYCMTTVYSYVVMMLDMRGHHYTRV